MKVIGHGMNGLIVEITVQEIGAIKGDLPHHTSTPISGEEIEIPSLYELAARMSESARWMQKTSEQTIEEMKKART